MFEYLTSNYNTDDSPFEITLRELIENLGKYKDFYWYIKEYDVMAQEMMLYRHTEERSKDYCAIWYQPSEMLSYWVEHKDFPLDTTIMVMYPRNT